MKSAVKICKVCSKEFRVCPYRSISAKYCSYQCREQANRETVVKRRCRSCGETFDFKRSQLDHYKGAGQYCSRECSYKGIAKAADNKPIKDKYGRSKRKEDKAWSKAVKERDEYTCRRCGKYEQYIHAHHVVPRSRSTALKREVNNGISLCNSCHTWVHKNPKDATIAGFLKNAPPMTGNI